MQREYSAKPEADRPFIGSEPKVVICSILAHRSPNKNILRLGRELKTINSLRG